MENTNTTNTTTNATVELDNRSFGQFFTEEIGLKNFAKIVGKESVKTVVCASLGTLLGSAIMYAFRNK